MLSNFIGCSKHLTYPSQNYFSENFSGNVSSITFESTFEFPAIFLALTSHKK